MQVQNSTNTNFKGGFRFPNMKTTARTQLPSIFKKGKQIFYDFERKGDVFLLTRPEKDYDVAKFIKKHRLNFEYYPEISTTTRQLDSEIHEPLSEMLSELKPHKISNFEDMMLNIKAKLRAENIAKSGLKAGIDPARLETDDRLLLNVGISISKGKHMIKDGIHMITGSNGEKALVSAPSKNGFRYIMYQPKSLEEEVKRYAVASDGMIIAEFKTPNEIAQFKRNVNATLIKKA